MSGKTRFEFGVSDVSSMPDECGLISTSEEPETATILSDTDTKCTRVINGIDFSVVNKISEIKEKEVLPSHNAGTSRRTFLRPPPLLIGERLSHQGSQDVEVLGSSSPLFYQSESIRKDLFFQLTGQTLEKVSRIQYLRSQYDVRRATGASCSLFEAEVDARFSNVPCPRHTAVLVGEKFLHANYVTDGRGDKMFVASQLPTQPELFWRFVFENNFSIFDLCVCNEKFYIEDLGSSVSYGTILVRPLEKNEETPDACMYVYSVEDISTKKTILISRYHFKGWNDHLAAPLPILKKLVSRLEFPGNLFVNCFAGLGRTGTLITAYFLKQYILRGEINFSNLGQSLINLIITFRQQRGTGFIQNFEQFDLLLDFALDLLPHE